MEIEWGRICALSAGSDAVELSLPPPHCLSWTAVAERFTEIHGVTVGV